MIEKLLSYFKFDDEKQQYELIKNSNVIVLILSNGWFEVNLLDETDPDIKWVHGGFNFMEDALNRAIELNFDLKMGNYVPKKGRGVAWVI